MRALPKPISSAGVPRATTFPARKTPFPNSASVAAALVGTFLGILLSYGFVAPLASLLEQKLHESTKMFQCMKVTLLASMNGYAPQVAVEFGRKVLYSTERPSFSELEAHVKQRLQQVEDLFRAEGFREEGVPAGREEGLPVVVEDAGRGWRKVVPSPRPLEVVQIEAIKSRIDL